MGLTIQNSGLTFLKKKNIVKNENTVTVALAGNPNVGKSTVFNGLTHMNQHTGNWPGKTVEVAKGLFKTEKRNYLLVDLPGTYSLNTASEEEAVAKEYMTSKEPEILMVVCDATALLRNLILALQILEIGKKTLIVVNLMDEAQRKGIEINLKRLSEKLNCPIVGTVARDKKCLENIEKELEILANKKGAPKREISEKSISERALSIYKETVKTKKEYLTRKDTRIDRFLTGKFTGFAVMALLSALIFYITIIGANYPSSWLANAFSCLGVYIKRVLVAMRLPPMLIDVLIDGIYSVLTTVISVMLPPMAIFFPMFTFLEDVGYLPRMAYNLDKPFSKCSSCGKQALCMSMGFGCNAAGVIGTRIIESKRERLLAILTNSFMPCNGRFPFLITLIGIGCISVGIGYKGIYSALFLTLFVILSVLMTFLCNKILSVTILKGESNAFVLEMPSFRKPQIGRIIVRSIFDRTLHVLMRAIIVAAPAGLVIWILANVTVGNQTLLKMTSDFLNPVGAFLGMDGVILLAFILGFPANEIVLPIILMCYTANNGLLDISSLEEIGEILFLNGWTYKTALCTALFSLFHFPCSTTVLTVKKETGSIKWTIFSMILPTIFGIILCTIVNLII